MAVDSTTILSIVFVMAVGVAVGTDMSLEQFQRLTGTWKPFLCGVVCQFIFMPLIVFAMSYVFESQIEANARHSLSASILGLTLVGCMPGSGTSNYFTYFVRGNLPLSIAMSACSTISALFMIPLLLTVYYEPRFDDSMKITLDWVNIIIPLGITVCGIVTGMCVKAFASFDCTWWVGKLASSFCLLFLFLAVVVGVARYSYILTEANWAFYVITLLIQPFGCGLGMLVSAVAGVGLRDQMTIAFETGVQSFTTGMAIAQLNFDADEDEALFVDVFKWNAICALWYSVHAGWLVLLFRKLLPGGYRPLMHNYPEEIWDSYKRKRHENADCFADACHDPIDSPGLGSLEAVPPATVPQLMCRVAQRYPQRKALSVERPVPPKGPKGEAKSLPPEQWLSWTWQEYLNDVERAAAALVAVPVEPFGSVTILGFNAPEWFIGAIAAMYIGAKVVGIYPTDTAEQIRYKTVHSGAAVAFIDEESRLQRYMEKASQMPSLRYLVIWGDVMESLLAGNDSLGASVRRWNDFLGRLPLDEDVRRTLDNRLSALRPGHCAAMVYTSGTTGTPKGVMVSHDNLVFASSRYLFIVREKAPEYKHQNGKLLTYLPLSHIAGFLADVVVPLYAGAYRNFTFQTFFARQYDLKDSTLGERLKTARPTWFLAVPRVYEKFAERLQEIGKRTTGWFFCFKKKDVATWSKRQGLQTARMLQVGESGRTGLFYGLAEALVLNPVQWALGLDECRYIITGAAPIKTETQEYFGSLGMMVQEVYGLSETTGMGTLSVDRRQLWGSCGFGAPGTQVKLCGPDGAFNIPACQDIMNPREEEQGELCMRGRHIMMGYMANPSLGDEHVEETLRQTLTTIDENGWLHTGDKACLGENRMFRITGRFKELIIGAGGENIAPVPIENRIQKACPGLSNVMVIGDQKKFLTCIVTLKAEGATGETPGTDNLMGAALQVSPGVTKVSQALTDPVWQKYVQSGLKEANEDPVACPNNASKIQKFKILPRDFSVITGELTATLKLRRSVAVQIWSREVDELYGESSRPEPTTIGKPSRISPA